MTHTATMPNGTESELGFQRVVEMVPAAIWCATACGVPSYINKRWTDTVGLGLDELIAPDGSYSPADVHPDDKAAIEAALACSFATGKAFCRTYRQRRVDGGYRWTETHSRAARTAPA